MKRYSTSLVIKGMQIKIIKRHHYTHIRIAEIKNKRSYQKMVGIQNDTTLE
jgi:hypothetical protein